MVMINWNNIQHTYSSVQFSHSVVSDSLRPHEPQHARPPCPSPTPRVHPNSCPLSRWCHPTISSFVVPFSSWPQSFPTSGSFQMSQLFASGGQSIGVSASASVLPMNTQDWSPLGWTGWISLQSKGLSTVFSNTTVQKHQFFSAHLSSQSNSHPYMTAGKSIALTRQRTSLVAQMVKCLSTMREDLGLVPRLGRFPGEGNGNPPQYSCLENPTDGGTWCRLLSMGSQRVGYDWETSLSFPFPFD